MFQFLGWRRSAIPIGVALGVVVTGCGTGGAGTAASANGGWAVKVVCEGAVPKAGWLGTVQVYSNGQTDTTLQDHLDAAQHAVKHEINEILLGTPGPIQLNPCGETIDLPSGFTQAIFNIQMITPAMFNALAHLRTVKQAPGQALEVELYDSGQLAAVAWGTEAAARQEIGNLNTQAVINLPETWASPHLWWNVRVLQNGQELEMAARQGTQERYGPAFSSTTPARSSSNPPSTSQSSAASAPPPSTSTPPSSSPATVPSSPPSPALTLNAQYVGAMGVTWGVTVTNNTSETITISSNEFCETSPSGATACGTALGFSPAITNTIAPHGVDQGWGFLPIGITNGMQPIPEPYTMTLTVPGVGTATTTLPAGSP